MSLACVQFRIELANGNRKTVHPKTRSTCPCIAETRERNAAECSAIIKHRGIETFTDDRRQLSPVSSSVSTVSVDSI